MTVNVPETMSAPIPANRRQHGPDDLLILSELHPDAVVDHLDGGNAPVDLMTFGHVREVCPKCKQPLSLVLRQARVRIAHLFCPRCTSCFDAHYPNGTPALTI